MVIPTLETNDTILQGRKFCLEGALKMRIHVVLEFICPNESLATHGALVGQILWVVVSHVVTFPIARSLERLFFVANRANKHNLNIRI